MTIYLYALCNEVVCTIRKEKSERFTALIWKVFKIVRGKN